MAKRKEAVPNYMENRPPAWETAEPRMIVDMAVDLRVEQVTRLNYDYDQIEDAGYRAAVIEAAIEIHQRREAGNREMLRIGLRLIEVKEMLGHGEFAGWLDEEFGYSEDTAQRMMAAARKFADDPNTAKLRYLAESTIYQLAAKSTPAEAVVRVVEMVEGGLRPTGKVVKAIIEEYRPPRPPRPPRPAGGPPSPPLWPPVVEEAEKLLAEEVEEIREVEVQQAHRLPFADSLVEVMEFKKWLTAVEDTYPELYRLTGDVRTALTHLQVAVLRKSKEQ